MSAGAKTDGEILQLLSEPTVGLLESVRRLAGDFVVLGAGGKMGPTLSVMLRRALDAVGRHDAEVLAVSRFGQESARAELEAARVSTWRCDLTCADQVAALPRKSQVLYLSGQKFGTEAAPGATWVQNTMVPALVAAHFRDSGIVVFSTGCVYPFMPVDGPGADENEPVAFLGEYASSCVGRERIFNYFASKHGTRQLMFRLNYAVELRYGVLVDIAVKVRDGVPVDVTMGWLNCIWQGDACARAIQCLEHVANPPRALNVTGPERLRVRDLALAFGERLGRMPVFTGTEAPTAWLADASASMRLFGAPTMSLGAMLDLIAAHVAGHGRLLNKPTHFEVRNGQF